MKRWLKVALELCLLLAVLAVLPTHARGYYEDDIRYAVEGGYIYMEWDTGTIVGYSGDITNVVIPSEIAGVTVRKIGDGAFADSSLTSIQLPDTVTRIGQNAFYCCEKLTGQLKLPAQLQAIGQCAFAECAGLTGDLEIPSGVKILAGAAFSGCTGLTSATIPEGLTELGNQVFGETGILSVKLPEEMTEIPDEMFYGCKQLRAIDIPDKVEHIGVSAFAGCVSLQSIQLPPNLHGLGAGAFEGCTSLKEVAFPEGMKEIEIDAFRDCTGLTRIILPSTAESISGFSVLPNLVEYRIPAGNLYYTVEDGVLFNADQTQMLSCPAAKKGAYTIPDTVKYLESGAMQGCKELTAVTIPEGVETIGTGAFLDCDALTEIYIPASVKNIWTAFEGCDGLQNILVAEGNETYCDADGVLLSKDGKVLVSYPSGRTGIAITPAGVEEIGIMAFCGNTGITGIRFAETTRKISNEAFVGCTGLTSVSLPAQIEELDSTAFTLCENLTTLYIWNPTCEFSQLYPTGLGVPSKTVVYSYPISTAKEYIERSGCIFADITNIFRDVQQTDWFFDEVQYTIEFSLMNGMENNAFQPQTPMTRGMLVTVLWRYANSPKEGSNTFSDVPSGKYYTEAVAWAAANGIVNGVGDGKFNPDGNITREQLVTILYRYCNKLDIDTSKADDLSAFPDAGSVGNSAKDAMRWAVAEKLINGSNGRLLPQNSATRAEVATLLMRFIENILK